MTNYYDILGVPKSANSDDIKRAYRKLASQHHPDRGGDTARFQEIQAAYDVLSDPNRRAQYDNPMFGSAPGGGWQQAQANPFGANFQDIFSMFGVNINQQQRMARISLWITLEDVVRGGPRIIALHANGKSSNVEIDIPVGIQDGDTIRYPRLSPDGSDLTITYRVKDHPVWIREGPHLMIDRTVSVWDLIVGGDLTIQDINGASVVVVIPPGTQPGSKLRLRGRGVPAGAVPGRASNVAGDMYVRLQAQIPTNISADLLSAIRREQSQ